MSDFKRDFRGGRGRDFSNRGNSPRPQMHKAICSTCGNACEVPFMPTGSKPVYCSNCFEKNGGRDANRSNFRDKQRSFSEDRPMFEAICDNCGNSCKIPFQPTTGKPVYCRNCFDSVVNTDPKKQETRAPQQAVSNTQFVELNAKLDKILELLSPKQEMNKPLEETIKSQVVPVTIEQEVISSQKKPRIKKSA